MSFPHIDFRRDDAGRAIAPDAEIGEDVYLGNNVTIYPDVHIGRGAIVMDNAILGRLPVSTPTVQLPVPKDFSPLQIGDGAVIGPNVIIYTGCHIGARTMIADGSSVREGNTIGEGVVVGRSSCIYQGCSIGKFTRIHDQGVIVPYTTIEEYVFIAASLSMANDNHVFLSRFGLAPLEVQSPIIRKYATIGSGVTLLPEVEIGTGAFVAAGAVVNADVAPWTLVAGVPAKKIKDIPAEWRQKILEKFEDDLS